MKKGLVALSIVCMLLFAGIAHAFCTGDVVNHQDVSRVRAYWSLKMQQEGQPNVGALYVCFPADSPGRMKFAFSYGCRSPQEAKDEASKRFDLMMGRCTVSGSSAISQDVQGYTGSRFEQRY